MHWVGEMENTTTEKEKHAAYMKEWGKANPLKLKVIKKTYYNKNIEKIKEYNQKNKKRHATRQGEYYKTHKDEINTIRRERYAAKPKVQKVIKIKKEASLSAEQIAERKRRSHEYYLSHKDKWPKISPEKNREKSHKWRKANLERARLLGRAQRLLHRDKYKENYYKWKASNPDKVKKICHEQRARKRNATIENFFVSEIYERDKWICGLCGKKVDKNLKYPNLLSKSLDHIIPLSKGGEHSRKNVQLSHLECNRRTGVGGIKQTRLF